MMRSRYTAILLILIVFGVGFSHRIECISRVITQNNHEFSNKSDHVPFINAKIIKVTASPDFSRIALSLQEQGPSMAVFDPVKKRIISREKSYNQVAEFSWSPDSRWLAEGSDKGLILIDRKGRTHLLHKDGSNPIWQPANSNKLVYTSTDIQTRNHNIREYNILTKTDRIIKRLSKVECIGYFNVKGRICAALLYRINSGGWYTWKRIDVVDLDSKRKIISLPGHGWDLDWAIFDMSPDGKIFTINAGASGDEDFIISRTSDAANILKHLNKTILYKRHSDGEVVWALNNTPSSDATKVSNNPDYGLVNSNVIPRTLLNLVNGRSHNQVGHLKNIAYITWWKNGPKPNPILKTQFLVVNSDGLWITANPKAVDGFRKGSIWPKDSQLILKHSNHQ